MKITKRDTRLILILLGLLAFILLYFVVRPQFIEKTATAQGEINKLQPKVEALEEHFANLETYRQETEDTKVYIGEQMKLYPSHIEAEEFLVWLLSMERKLETDYSQVSFELPEMFSEFSAYATVDGKETLVDMTAYKMGAGTTGQMSYEQLKAGIDYIYDASQRTALDSVTVSYSEETGQLDGNMTLAKYYISYPNARYMPLGMPTVDLGISDPFGTLNNQSAETSEDEE